MHRGICVLIGASCGCGSVESIKPPDAPSPIWRTCAEAARHDGATGRTTLDPDGDGPAAPRDVWCEQSRRGGGWALALKVDGTSAMFAGTSAIWSDQTLRDGNNLDPQAAGSAKLAPYVDYPAAEVMLVVDGGQDVVLPLRTTSLRAAMTAEQLITPTTLAPREWTAAFAAASLATGACVRQGFAGNSAPAASSFRIGLVAGDGLVGCRAPQTFVGIGGDVACADGTTLVAGTATGMGAAAAAQCKPARVLVFVRDDDRTYHPALASCKDHLAAGRLDSGTYLVGNPAVPRRCEMSIDGGGWTNALDLDSVRDPCPAPWEPAATGPKLCVNDKEGITSITIVPPLAKYREVMTSLVAFQSGSTDGFSNATAIDGPYLDGLSITVGAAGSRQHVASYAAGISDEIACDSTGGCACPCRGGLRAPPYAADSYRCESGAIDGRTPSVLLDDPLFDGAEAPAACTAEAGPEPIVKRFAADTTANIEARLMRDEPVDDTEGMSVYRLEVWVR